MQTFGTSWKTKGSDRWFCLCSGFMIIACNPISVYLQELLQLRSTSSDPPTSVRQNRPWKISSPWSTRGNGSSFRRLLRAGSYPASPVPNLSASRWAPLKGSSDNRVGKPCAGAGPQRALAKALLSLEPQKMLPGVPRVWAGDTMVAVDHPPQGRRGRAGSTNRSDWLDEMRAR